MRLELTLSRVSLSAIFSIDRKNTLILSGFLANIFQIKQDLNSKKELIKKTVNVKAIASL